MTDLAVLGSCLLTLLTPFIVFSKTVHYDYSASGFLIQARTVSGPVFDYDYDPVGNRKTMTISPLDSDDDGLGNGEEISVYGTDPYLADTDGDGLDDGEEAAYWGADWNSDIDNDGLINLLDIDSDGDGYNDGFEIERGTDPGDPDDHPSMVLAPILFLLLNEQESP
jgi:hypothetical protein